MRLNDAYRKVAERQGIRFVDATDWDIEVTFDGVHYSEKGHQTFARAAFLIIKLQFRGKNLKKHLANIITGCRIVHYMDAVHTCVFTSILFVVSALWIYGYDRRDHYKENEIRHSLRLRVGFRC